MTKILFYIDTLKAGGAEKVLCNLVNAMDHDRFAVTVVTPFPENTAALSPQVHYLSLYPAKNTLTRYLYRLESALGTAVRRLPKDQHLEVAYLECGPTKFLAGSKSKAKKLAWVHCDLILKSDNPAAFAKKTAPWYEKYDHVVCVSESVRESFHRLYNGRFPSSVLYNVNDEGEILRKAEAFLPEKSDVPTLCAVGRLTAQKGFDRLIEACAQLSVPYRLQIIGEGPDRPKLEEAIARAGLEDRIRLLGWQENPYPYLKNADLVVCSSRYEGLSTVVTEALILGKAVVTTPCNGMAELLGDSEYGLITEDLCDGLTRMLTERDLREHYEAMSARRGGDLRGAELARRTEAFFTELLEGTSQ